MTPSEKIKSVQTRALHEAKMKNTGGVGAFFRLPQCDKMWGGARNSPLIPSPTITEGAP